MNGGIVVVVGAQIENSYGNIQHVITWIKPKTLIPEYIVPCFSNIPPRLQTFSDEWRMTEDNWIVWSWHVSSLCLDLIYLPIAAQSNNRQQQCSSALVPPGIWASVPGPAVFSLYLTANVGKTWTFSKKFHWF